MNNVRTTLIAGIALGLAGVAGQILMMWLNWPTPARAGWTILLAATIGVLAGLKGREEALKSAGLAGFIMGAMVTAVGMSTILRNPGAIGSPFASAEAFFSFVSSVLAGTVISAWLVAAVAVLTALPISQTLHRKEEPAL